MLVGRDTSIGAAMREEARAAVERWSGGAILPARLHSLVIEKKNLLFTQKHNPGPNAQAQTVHHCVL